MQETIWTWLRLGTSSKEVQGYGGEEVQGYRGTGVLVYFSRANEVTDCHLFKFHSFLVEKL